MRALLIFARLPDPLARRLATACSRHGVEIVGIAAHRGEDPRRLAGSAATAWWHDYRPELATPFWSGPPLEDLLRPHEILRALPSVERFSPRIGGSAEAIWRLRSDLSRASRLLEESRPDVLLSLDPPEGGLELMLHALATRAGVPSFWLRRGLTPFSRTAVRDPFSAALGPDGRIAPGVVRLGGASSPEAREQVDGALAAMIAGRDPDVIPNVPRELISTAGPRRLARRVARRSAAYNRHRRSRPLLGGPRFLEDLRDRLDAHAVRWDRGDGSPVALLALHYQPELSTLTLGGWATRQMEAAKLLADHLPDGWRLLVKEHPSTFARGHSKTTVTYRPPDFYERIAAMPRTTLLPIDQDIRDRWADLSLVATATGTMGLEALAMGVPVVHFGAAPYENFHGAFRVGDQRPESLVSAVEASRRLDRTRIATAFHESATLIEDVSHQTTEPTLGGRMVATMEVLLDRGLPAT